MSKLLANQIANYGDDAPIEIKEGLNIPAGKPIQAAGSAGSSGQVLSTTGTSIAWVDSFDGNYNSLSNRPSIPAAQVPADWDAVSGVARILNKPLVPPLPSVNTTAAGSAALTYNSVNGEFAFTPPDLSSYATETWVTGRGYLTSYTETDTLDSVTGRGATTSNAITVGNLTATGVSATVDNLVLGNSSTAYTIRFSQATGASARIVNSITQSGLIIQGAYSGGSTFAEDIYLGTSGDSSRFKNLVPQTNLTYDLGSSTAKWNNIYAGKLYYSNVFDTLTNLQTVDTAAYHGMFAHAHDTGHGYFAHAGAWVQLVDTTSSIDELGDVDLSSAPSDGYVLKWEASSSSWKAQPDLVGSGGSGIVLGDLSVSTQSASGGGSLSYGNTTGVFTYTPPDLSGFLTTETDPVFTASAAAGIQSSNIANWDAAYGWGNHATAGYLTSLSIDLADLTDVSINQANISNGDVLAWNQTNSRWENSTPTGGSESDTLSTVTGRDAVTTNAITVGGLTVDGAGNSVGKLTITDQGSYSQITFHNNTGDPKVSLKGIGDNLYIEGGAGIIRLHTFALFDAIGNVTLNNSGNGNTTIGGSLTAGGLTYPTTNGTSGQVLTSDGAGNVTWSTVSSGGANVTISDTLPAGTPAAGDLWWESDTGRLKVYYTDTDGSQWVDASPPLTQDRIASSSAPSSASDTGTPGDIRYDSGYVYICIANNTWKRAALATW